MSTATDTDNLLNLENQIEPSFGQLVTQDAAPEVIKIFNNPTLMTAGSPGLAFIHAWGAGVTIAAAALHLSQGASTAADAQSLGGYAGLATEFAAANAADGFAFLSGLATFGKYSSIVPFLDQTQSTFPGLGTVLTSLNGDASSFLNMFISNAAGTLQSTGTQVIAAAGLP